MENNNQILKLVVRITLWIVLVGLLFWSSMELASNYHKIEISNKMIEALLINKMELARKYAEELGLTRESLLKTEAIVKDLKAENEVLREKIKLLDQLSTLEAEISRLKEKNALLVNQLSLPQEKRVRTIKEAQDLIKEYKAKLKEVKRTKRHFELEAYQQQKETQRERDRINLMNGNNGYAVRDGEITLPQKQRMPPQPNIEIKVEFVR